MQDLITVESALKFGSTFYQRLLEHGQVDLAVNQARSVLLAATDTFRAGAIEQLGIWSDRLGVDMVKGAPNADPASVAFDAADAAIARGFDALLIDTAVRLHTQQNLMRQLTKIRDVVRKKIPTAPHEVLLVLDATAGQNAIAQAQIFRDAIDLPVLTLEGNDEFYLNNHLKTRIEAFLDMLQRSRQSLKYSQQASG